MESSLSDVHDDSQEIVSVGEDGSVELRFCTEVGMRSASFSPREIYTDLGFMDFDAFRRLLLDVQAGSGGRMHKADLLRGLFDLGIDISAHGDPVWSKTRAFFAPVAEYYRRLTPLGEHVATHASFEQFLASDGQG